jgi:hypothetical protein
MSTGRRVGLLALRSYLVALTALVAVKVLSTFVH